MPSSDKFLHLNQNLYDYVIAHGHNGDPILRDLAEETRKLGRISGMQIAPEQGTLMGLLAECDRREVSDRSWSLHRLQFALRRARPARLTGNCCASTSTKNGPRSRGATGSAPASRARSPSSSRRRWKASARFLPRIAVDFAFVDADKSNYRIYYEEILKRLRTNGLLLIDNVLWNGQVVEASDKSEDTVAIRALNDFIATDTRVEAVMIPVADGITIVRKK